MKTGQDSSVSVAVKITLSIQNLPYPTSLWSWAVFSSAFLFFPFLFGRFCMGFGLGLLDWRTGRGSFFYLSVLYCFYGDYRCPFRYSTRLSYYLFSARRSRWTGIDWTGWDGIVIGLE